jgi:plasmid stability protein
VKSLHIRDVSTSTIESLKRIARRNHRSLQGELRDILEKASRRAPAAEDDELDIVTVNTGSVSTLPRGEIYGDSGR